MDIIRITDSSRQIIAPEWLARAEAVHRELRPQLQKDYCGQMAGIFQDGGEMIIAIEGEQVQGVAVYRSFRCTVSGARMYVDDLITTAGQRSQGVGQALLNWLKEEANARTLAQITLDSGTQRQQAHKFYFREDLSVTAFHFTQPLQGTP